MLNDFNLTVCDEKVGYLTIKIVKIALKNQTEIGVFNTQTISSINLIIIQLLVALSWLTQRMINNTDSYAR